MKVKNPLRVVSRDPAVAGSLANWRRNQELAYWQRRLAYFKSLGDKAQADLKHATRMLWLVRIAGPIVWGGVGLFAYRTLAPQFGRSAELYTDD
jgi:hypothetical protein